MKRRTFAAYAGLGVAAISLPIGYYQLRIPDYDSAIKDPELVSQIWDTDSINQIGQFYREMFSDEDSERRLVSLLLENLPEGSPDAAAGVRQSIMQDFENGHIVMLDGWLLSRTEARQCALFSLTQSK